MVALDAPQGDLSSAGSPLKCAGRPSTRRALPRRPGCQAVALLGRHWQQAGRAVAVRVHLAEELGHLIWRPSGSDLHLAEDLGHLVARLGPPRGQYAHRATHRVAPPHYLAAGRHHHVIRHQLAHRCAVGPQHPAVCPHRCVVRDRVRRHGHCAILRVAPPQRLAVGPNHHAAGRQCTHRLAVGPLHRAVGSEAAAHRSDRAGDRVAPPQHPAVGRHHQAVGHQPAHDPPVRPHHRAVGPGRRGVRDQLLRRRHELEVIGMLAHLAIGLAETEHRAVLAHHHAVGPHRTQQRAVGAEHRAVSLQRRARGDDSARVGKGVGVDRARGVEGVGGHLSEHLSHLSLLLRLGLLLVRLDFVRSLEQGVVLRPCRRLLRGLPRPLSLLVILNGDDRGGDGNQHLLLQPTQELDPLLAQPLDLLEPRRLGGAGQPGHVVEQHISGLLEAALVLLAAHPLDALAAVGDDRLHLRRDLILPQRAAVRVAQRLRLRHLGRRRGWRRGDDGGAGGPVGGGDGGHACEVGGGRAITEVLEDASLLELRPSAVDDGRGHRDGLVEEVPLSLGNGVLLLREGVLDGPPLEAAWRSGLLAAPLEALLQRRQPKRCRWAWLLLPQRPLSGLVFAPHPPLLFLAPFSFLFLRVLGLPPTRRDDLLRHEVIQLDLVLRPVFDDALLRGCGQPARTGRTSPGGAPRRGPAAYPAPARRPGRLGMRPATRPPPLWPRRGGRAISASRAWVPARSARRRRGS
eukprot:scaffold43883_cov65-Phaeocystis_antarctica.AAC.2